ncbi:MAG TPA: phosphodiester glycosidase family protein [Actinomycetota bacterium]|nr:phosphodiester glycosidase family protein [Actinomycetota bacterium]
MTGRREKVTTYLSIAVSGLCLIVASMGPATRASARSRYRVTRSRVADGITLATIKDRRGPNEIKVLKVEPQGTPTLDVALANDELDGHETTSSMAARHHAVAAINGDFTLRPQDRGSGRPIDTFAEDGRMVTSPLIWGRNFSISRDETSVRFGHNRLDAWVVQRDSGQRWRVPAVNPLVQPTDAYAIYTRAGGSVAKPPSDACSARLFAADNQRWTSGRLGLERLYTVRKVQCGPQPLPRRRGIVLAAPIDSKQGAQMQTTLLPGESVVYGWSLNRYGILDTIGGNPDLVEDGAVATGSCTTSYFCRANPRSGIGWKPDGTILLVTVDGRSKASIGMTPEQFARFFIHLGAKWALNLDGGGSTTMVVRDRVVNRPSSGYERPVGSALVVLEGPDPDEVEPGEPLASPSPTPPLPTPVPSAAGVSRTRPAPLLDGFQGVMPARCGALFDPGSTGGLLDALARGELNARDRDLGPSLRWAVRVFRGSAPCR